MVAASIWRRSAGEAAGYGTYAPGLIEYCGWAVVHAHYPAGRHSRERGNPNGFVCQRIESHVQRR